MESLERIRQIDEEYTGTRSIRTCCGSWRSTESESVSGGGWV